MALVRVFEQEFVSYTNFITANHTADNPLYFKLRIDASELRWTPDYGTCPESITEIKYHDPYQYRSAFYYDEGAGWRLTFPKEDIEYINDNDYIAYYNLDFNCVPATFEVMCSSDGGNGEIEIHLDSINGPIVGICNISNTDGWLIYEAFSCDISTTFEGIHDIYLVFKSTSEEYLFNVRSWYLGKSDLLTPQTPYHGVASVLLGKMEAEEYDVGGSTISFLDKNSVNHDSFFREDDVDIDTTMDGSYCIAWTGENEWLEYTVSCEQETVMDLQLRVACMESGNKFRIKLNNKTFATASLPNTGGWQNWKLVTIENITIQVKIRF